MSNHVQQTICTKPHCACLEIEEQKQGGGPIKNGYPCLAVNKFPDEDNAKARALIDNWSIPVNGIVHIPDYLDPLFNSIATQIKFHKHSGKGEMAAVCSMVYAAEQFFAKRENENIEAACNAMAEGADLWKQEYISARAIIKELVDLKFIKDNFGKTDEYLERQPVAWENAITFLSNFQHQ